MDLSGKVVVVPVAWAPAADLASRLAERGATVVLVGADAEEAGRLAALLEKGPSATVDGGTGDGGSGRPAVFVADGSPTSLDALAAFLAEMFPATIDAGRFGSA